ncbi:hypothetical protein PV327_004096 [Microctonus hyperodae]|uniref:Uncharacterized protein n=1 Tax=Microctonus hyperodae TaxID=165561 RepID=A0AA39FBU1_MICHY|nr:hypothetical protein PV327_004096 [Microctonus hyperodae]
MEEVERGEATPKRMEGAMEEGEKNNYGQEMGTNGVGKGRSALEAGKRIANDLMTEERIAKWLIEEVAKRERRERRERKNVQVEYMKMVAGSGGGENEARRKSIVPYLWWGGSGKESVEEDSKG